MIQIVIFSFNFYTDNPNPINTYVVNYSLVKTSSILVRRSLPETRRIFLSHFVSVLSNEIWADFFNVKNNFSLPRSIKDKPPYTADLSSQLTPQIG